MTKDIFKSTKRIKPNSGKKTQISIKSSTNFEELPLPYVHYPNLYGIFLTFSEYENSQQYFCLCNKDAIENYFSLRTFEDDSSWSDKKISNKLSSHFFSENISEKSDSEVLNNIIIYKARLCHRCNLITPGLRYCHEMYGGNFRQYHGWYINLNMFKMGIRGDTFLDKYTPDEISKLVAEYRHIKKRIDFSKDTYSEREKIDIKLCSKIHKEIHNYIENITRKDFGYRKIGEGNISESILINIVRSIIPNKDIKIHYRPKWLEGLELDIFIPELNLGIEYQGKQHFYAIKAWGGEKALEKLQERDTRKRIMCKQENIRLLEIDYTEPLEKKYIQDKIGL